MESFENLHIKWDETGRRLKLAESILTDGNGTIIVGNTVILLSRDSGIECAVIHSSHKGESAEIFRDEIEESRKFLCRSSICTALERRELDWMVVADTGKGWCKVWPIS
jgi:hypothetical protein